MVIVRIPSPVPTAVLGKLRLLSSYRHRPDSDGRIDLVFKRDMSLDSFNQRSDGVGRICAQEVWKCLLQREIRHAIILLPGSRERQDAAVTDLSGASISDLRAEGHAIDPDRKVRVGLPDHLYLPGEP